MMLGHTIVELDKGAARFIRICVAFYMKSEYVGLQIFEVTEPGQSTRKNEELLEELLVHIGQVLRSGTFHRLKMSSVGEVTTELLYFDNWRFSPAETTS